MPRDITGVIEGAEAQLERKGNRHSSSGHVGSMRRQRLPDGYVTEKLLHQARSLFGHELGEISPAERRKTSLHLPDDLSSLPFTKREEILDYVREVIISGSTEYRRYQAAASTQR